ncbi:restriction endonuclease subunit S [Cruoricaptor ignavus]|uniref:restriction endonuclease subunit S n=1 Tax=Cruoricaptor ignavus TaxID=1118202 RepID=UPI00370D7B37
MSSQGDYAVYQNSLKPLGFYHDYNVEANTTFIIAAGSAGEIGFSEKKFWAADDVYYLKTPEDFNNKFLYYYLLTKQNSIVGKVRRASVPRLSRLSFENIKIPVPPIEEQNRIVEVLDKFDTLTTSISEGLPKEIALRQKQYEHYRDQLLNFQ